MNKKITYIICYSFEGGTKKFLLDLENFFPQTEFIKVLGKDDMNVINLSLEANVLINNLSNTDIVVQDLIELKNSNPKLKFYIVLHDMYWLNYDNLTNNQTELTNYYSNLTNTHLSVHGIYLKPNITLCPLITNLFNLCENVICPSKFVYTIYSSQYTNSNLIIVPHIDIDLKQNPIQTHYIPPFISNTINVGCLNYNHYHKGINLITHLKSNYTKYNNWTINWFIVGENIPIYNENEFFEIITKYNIHCLTYLSIVGETWCYSLTKGIKSQLPIFYNNIGSFAERVDKSIETNFIAYQNEQEIQYDTEMKILTSRFEQFLNLLIGVNYNQETKLDYNNLKYEIDNFYINTYG